MSTDIYCSCLKINGERCNYKAKKKINELLCCKIHWRKILKSQINNSVLEYSIDNNIFCSICLTRMLYTKKINLCITTCWHIFHLNCMNKWITEHNTCPICRFHQNKNDLILLRKPHDSLINSLNKNFKAILNIASLDKLHSINNIFIEILSK